LAIDIIVEAFNADKQGHILDFFLKCVSRTGNTFEQRILGSRGIDTQDPQNIEAILSTQFTGMWIGLAAIYLCHLTAPLEFGLGAREQNFRPLLGHGIFTQNGPAWRQSRDLLRPQFMRTRSEYFSEVKTIIEKLVTLLEDSASRGPVDLQPLFFSLALDVTTAVFFGKSVDSMAKQGTGVDSEFGIAFNDAQHELARRGRLGDLYWLLGGRSFRQACKTVHQFVDDIVADGIARSQTDLQSSKSSGFVFLDALIAETKDATVIRDQLVNILLAGRDTTACLLSWTL
jgi:cytochrome P450